MFVFALIAAACGDSGGGGETSTSPTAAPEPADTDTGTTEGDTGGGTTTTFAALEETEVEETEGEIRYGGQVIVGLAAETGGWRPWEDASAADSRNPLRAIFDQLVEKTAEGDVAGYLAESVVPNETLDVWTLTLRPGVVFHDGSELTAETLQIAYDEFLKEGAITSGQLSAAGVTEVRVVDDLTVEYVLSAPNAGFPDTLIFASGRVFSIEAARADPEGFAQNPVGTGPFKFVSWDPDNEIILERNENYWRTDPDGNPLPYLDRLIFRPIPDEGTRLDSLLAGNIDAMQTLRGSTIRDAQNAGDQITLYQHQGGNSGGWIFNVLQPPVDDVRVRAGLVQAVNRDALIEVLGGTGIQTASSQLFGPDSPWYSQTVADAWPEFSIADATVTLQEYVDDPARSDGLAAGSTIQIDWNCPPDPSLIAVSESVKELWEATGLVSVNLNQLEQATHIAVALGGPEDPAGPFTGDFMINCWRMGSAEDADPSSFIDAMLAPTDLSPINFTNYFNPELFGLLQQAKSVVDFDTRYGLYEQVSMILATDFPMGYAGNTATLIATKPEVVGINGWHIPSGELAHGHPNAEGRWVEVWRTDA